VRYVILVYSNPANWKHPMFLHYESLTDEERAEMLGQAEAVWAEIDDTGERVDSGALADPMLTKTVRAVDGAPAITDGPFAEAKEHLAGFFVVECESHERALKIAARFPDIRYGPVEVRPIMDLSSFSFEPW
jgi:hypothetical protein